MHLYESEIKYKAEIDEHCEAEEGDGERHLVLRLAALVGHHAVHLERDLRVHLRTRHQNQCEELPGSTAVSF